MRSRSTLVILAAGFALSLHVPAEINCGAGVVRATLDSMVRERVVRVITDSLPPAPLVTGRPALAATTRVSIRAPRLIEWESIEGRIKCAADVVVEAPAGYRGPALPTRTELHYRVMSGNADSFLVEIAYADLMNAFAPQSPSTRKAVSIP
jgi:hypothetical protein